MSPSNKFITDRKLPVDVSDATVLRMARLSASAPADDRLGTNTMCTLIVVKNLLSDTPLIVAANRDEAYARLWDGPSYDPTPPGIVRPTDRTAGGTWIGVNQAHLAVAVTNRRPVQPAPSRRSRGLLCTDVLANATFSTACAALQNALRRELYNDFNMLVADAHKAVVVHHQGDQTRTIPLPDGVHILSNYHDLDDPVWRDTRVTLTSQAQQGWPALHAALETALATHQPALDGHLTCKHGERYGTLCSSIIRMAAEGPPAFWFASGAPCVTPFILAPRT